MPEELVKSFETMFALHLGIFIGIFLTFILLSWLLNVISLMLGAKIAGVNDRSFGKALLATVLIVLFGGLVVALLTALHPIAGLIGAFIVPCMFIQWVYSCSFGKAAVAYILSFFANVAFIFAAIITIPLVFSIVVGNIKNTDSKEKPKIEQTSQTKNKQQPSSQNQTQPSKPKE